MQRKDLLKGKLYAWKGSLIRVLDTSDSPVTAEIYEYVSQQFVPASDVPPRDISTVDGFDIVEIREAVDNARDLRQLFAQIDAFNEKFGTKAEEKAGRRQVGLRVSDLGSPVTLSAADYNIAVEAGVEAPNATVTLTAREFIAFSQSVGVDLQPIEEAKSDFPIYTAEQFAPERIAAIVADRAEKAARRDKAREIVWGLRDQYREEARKLHAEGKLNVRKGTTWISETDHPDWVTNVTKALNEAGLSPDDAGHYLGR